MNLSLISRQASEHPDGLNSPLTRPRREMYVIDSRIGRPDPELLLFDIDDNFLAVNLQKIEELRSLPIDKNAIAIGQKDIGSKGLVIDAPGDYYLKEDIVFNPEPPQAGQIRAAITIKASNVTLFLNAHKLTHAGFTDASEIPWYSGARKPSNQAPFITGILIPDVLFESTDPEEIGLKGINIIGNSAVIDGFSQYGIRVLGHTSDICMLDITIKNCGNLASFYLRPKHYKPTSEGDLPFGVGGLCIGESPMFGMGPSPFIQMAGLLTQNRIHRMVIAGIDCLNNFLFGFCMANVTTYYIGKCNFEGNFSDDASLLPRAAFFTGVPSCRSEIDKIVCNKTLCKF